MKEQSFIRSIPFILLMGTGIGVLVLLIAAIFTSADIKSDHHKKYLDYLEE